MNNFHNNDEADAIMREERDRAVLIPQYPTQMGRDGPERRPLDLEDATRYGRLVELIGPTAKPWDSESMDQLDAAISDTSADDWLLCVGNPVMIAAAAGAFALAHQRLNLLQWQSRRQRYEAVQLDFLSSSIKVSMATLGEDDEH